MIKILVCCASGSGTSMLTKLTAEKACKAIGVEASVSHAPVAEGKSSARSYDLIITSPAFLKNFENTGVKVATIKNPLSQPEIEAAIKNSGMLD